MEEVNYLELDEVKGAINAEEDFSTNLVEANNFGFDQLKALF